MKVCALSVKKHRFQTMAHANCDLETRFDCDQRINQYSRNSISMNISTLYATPIRQSLIVHMTFLLLLNFLFMTSNLYAAEVSVTWNANRESDLAGYRVFQRLLPSNDYRSAVFSGLPSNPKAPQITISNLLADTTYGFIATAFDSSGNESQISREAIVTTTSNSGDLSGGSTSNSTSRSASGSTGGSMSSTDGSISTGETPPTTNTLPPTRVAPAGGMPPTTNTLPPTRVAPARGMPPTTNTLPPR